MQAVGWALSGIGFLGSLVCFILVVVKLFQTGQTALGIVCIVLFFCCGLGLLVGLVIGWLNAGRWRSQNLMIAYSVCMALYIVGGVLAPPDFSQLQQQLQQNR
jgi:NhaP-type Na+/H+ or K+/H+ antiporter